MVRKSMAEALAEDQELGAEDLEQNRKEAIEQKRRALRSERVTEFIKKGPSKEAEVAEEEKPHVKEVTEYVQLNVRIPAALLMRVKRAAFENQSSNLEPSTIQGVVVEALNNDLKRMGY